MSRKGAGTHYPRPMRAFAFLAVLTAASSVFAQNGVPQNGYPDWQERMVLVYTNRTRADPQADLAVCPTTGSTTMYNVTAGPCAEKACYTTRRAPLAYNYNLSRSSRFHSANLRLTSCFQHESPCTLVSNISSIWENGCDGSRACSCQGSSTGCAVGTDPFVRMTMFGGSGSGENIAYGYAEPRRIYYLWLWEPDTNATCGFRQENGHRANMVSGSHKSLGVGRSVTHYGQDFGGSGTPPTLVAGGHENASNYTQFIPSTGSANVEFRVNYYHASGAPSTAEVNVDGTCTTMTLERGIAGNATYLATIPLSGTSCHRYVFTFKDPNGQTVVLPESGSYGVGASLASCADWTSSAPQACGGSSVNTAPNITSAAAANPSPVSLKTTQLSVAAVDDTGEGQLTYQWTQTAGPNGVTFSVNGTNAAKTTTATFPAPGTYSFQVTVTDPGSLSSQSSVTVDVLRTAVTVTVTPSAVTIAPSATQQFTANVIDQFNQAITNPTLLWSVNGGGTVDTAGLFTADAITGGPHTVTATSGAASGSAYVTISSGPADTTPPQVFITGPIDGSTVNGLETISASASDDTGVAKVIFFVDGAQVGEDSTVPYTSSWNAAAATGGQHEIRARAVDFAGNAADAVIFLIVPGGSGTDGGSGGGSGSNDQVSPTVRMVTPGEGATIAGVTELVADASDNVGVVQVSFVVDGVPSGTATSSPWTVSYDTTALKEGGHDIYAVAQDAAGNQGTSLPVHVNVSTSAEGGCHCSSTGGALLLLPLALMLLRRRRERLD